MRVIPRFPLINLSIDAELYRKNSSEWFNSLNNLPEDTLLFIISKNYAHFTDLHSKTHLQLVPVYSALRDGSNFSRNTDLAQINQSGNLISPYYCPNNPKVVSLIKNDFESLHEASPIAGILLDSLEIPFQPPIIGCFCAYCSTLAEEKGINLSQISHEITRKMKNGVNWNWVTKNYPEWLQFRVDSISNLAGKLMITIRKLDPNIFLGMTVPFSYTPEMFGHDYFFLSLYLDLLNFSVNENILGSKKKLLKQIRAVAKKFIGEYRIFLQMKVPHELNVSEIKMGINTLKKNSFDGLIFHVSTLNELKKIIKIGVLG